MSLDAIHPIHVEADGLWKFPGTTVSAPSYTFTAGIFIQDSRMARAIGHPRTELRMYGVWGEEIVLQCRLYPKGTVHHTAPSLLRRRRHHGPHIIGAHLDPFPARPPRIS
jgi:hypothetical protein